LQLATVRRLALRSRIARLCGDRACWVLLRIIRRPTVPLITTTHR
jgi:hypothetical protein